MSTKKFTRNKQEKIEKIYGTFFNLVLTQGFHGTSTNHVAKEANISIGTIYKYFPKGKEDILRKYFEESMEAIVDREEMKKTDTTNSMKFLKEFAEKIFDNHKKNRGYNMAFRSAIQSDKELHDIHEEKINSSFKELVHFIREDNPFFKTISEQQLTKAFIFLYNILNAVIYHHLCVMPLFDTDQKLIDYLVRLIEFSLKQSIN